MTDHFLFQPGEWLGTGQVSFSMSPDVLHFHTRWTIHEETHGAFHCVQIVEIVGGDRMVNIFEVTPKDPDTFTIILENELLGTFSGIGVLEKGSIAWEFRQKGTFEGYEVYRYIQDGEYTMHAEYISSDQTRTLINGKLWRRTTHIPDDAYQELTE